MPIIGTLPNILTNGTTADASQVMADFNFIVNQVNANGNPTGTLTAPSGTRTVFHQASAPLGWVQDATLTDHTLQVIGTAGGATGGANAYSSMFSSAWTSDGHSLSIAELAAHSHVDAGHVHGDSGHAHTQNALTYYNAAGSSFVGGGAGQIVSPGGQSTLTGFANIQSANANIQNTGSGNAHSHTKTFNANYAQVIMCQKS
jgi:hypothetical protein